MKLSPEVLNVLAQLDDRLWGTIELTVQEGSVVFFKTTQTTKISGRSTRQDDRNR
jgi:hypothetical protein